MKVLIRLIYLWILVILFSCDNAGNVDSVTEKYFIKYYGDDGDQNAVDMVVANDGDIFVLGKTFQSGKKDILLLHLDSKGVVKSQTKIGDGSENPQDIEPASDGNFVILSNVQIGKDPVTGSDLYDIKLFMVSADGEVLKTTILDRPSAYNDANLKIKSWVANSITPIADGGFLLAGNTSDTKAFDEPLLPSPPDQEDIIFARLDNKFEIVWTQIRGNEHTGAGIKFFENNQSSGNPFLLFGYTDALVDNDPSFESNFWFVSVNQVGSNSAAFYDGDNTGAETMQYACEVPEALGGGYICIGSQKKEDGRTGTYVVKLRNDISFSNSGGGRNIVFKSSISSNGVQLQGVSITPVVNSSSGYIVLADEFSSSGGYNMQVRKIDVTGQEVEGWSKSFGSVGEDRGAAIRELNDGRIAVLGTVELETQKKIALIIISQSGTFY